MSNGNIVDLLLELFTDELKGMDWSDRMVMADKMEDEGNELCEVVRDLYRFVDKDHILIETTIHRYTKHHYYLNTGRTFQLETHNTELFVELKKFMKIAPHVYITAELGHFGTFREYEIQFLMDNCSIKHNVAIYLYRKRGKNVPSFVSDI